MDSSIKIGFIGGGQMAEALIRGIINGGGNASNLFVTDPVVERCDFLQEEYQINASPENLTIWSCQVIIIAVKPQVVDLVLSQNLANINNDSLFISIAAGVTIASLERTLGEFARVVRVMPNTPALVLEGASALSPGKNAIKEDLAVAKDILEAVGLAIVLPESYLDAVTGLSGSGPAYVFSFLEALIEGALKTGLNRSDAELLAMQTILGSVKLAMETKLHPAVLKAMVTSPGGTTIAGLHELEKGAFKATVMNCVEAATSRSKELGQN